MSWFTITPIERTKKRRNRCCGGVARITGSYTLMKQLIASSQGFLGFGFAYLLGFRFAYLLTRRKEQALLFKVDFQKAFDSVRWDHLDDILGKFGFGSKWRCGLFIEWSSSNVNMLMMMLHWFFLVSGLKFNVHKSSLYRLGVHYSDIQSMANSFGCLANNLSFTYLDVKVAANMARINSCNKVIQKVIIKLSNWKAKSLSVGGRLTLLKSVLGSLPTYYISLFKALDGVLSHLERVRSSFFLGAEMDERKMTWVSDLASSKLFTVLMAHLISLPVHGARKLFNLDLQKDASVAQKFQNPEFVVSFPRCPRSDIESSL
ncbi:hypothetical protein Tco_1465776 [Tanacetum coccineum]